MKQICVCALFCALLCVSCGGGGKKGGKSGGSLSSGGGVSKEKWGIVLLFDKLLKHEEELRSGFKFELSSSFDFLDYNKIKIYREWDFITHEELDFFTPKVWSTNRFGSSSWGGDFDFLNSNDLSINVAWGEPFWVYD